MIVGGPESEGHLTGEALKALIRNGVDEKMRIRETSAPHPFLYNLPMEFIDRFRKQLSVINLQFEGNPELIRKAVWSCYQENAVEFTVQQAIGSKDDRLVKLASGMPGGIVNLGSESGGITSPIMPI